MDSLVQELQSSGRHFVVVVAGGGVRALDRLYTAPGASRMMLESRIIYAEESMERYLGFKPERSVSEHTAYAMAIEAYAVAARLNSLAPVGVACTAALATDHLRRGDDHAWLAIATSGHVFAHHIVLNKDLARAEQEDKLADIIVRLMATPEVWSSTVDYLAEAYGSFTPGSFHRPTSLDALVNA